MSSRKTAVLGRPRPSALACKMYPLRLENVLHSSEDPSAPRPKLWARGEKHLSRCGGRKRLLPRAQPTAPRVQRSRARLQAAGWCPLWLGGTSLRTASGVLRRGAARWRSRAIPLSAQLRPRVRFPGVTSTAAVTAAFGVRRGEVRARNCE